MEKNAARYSFILCKKTNKLHIKKGEKSNVPIDNRSCSLLIPDQRNGKIEQGRGVETTCNKSPDREQLLPLHNQRNALALNGYHFRAAPVHMVENKETSQLPGAELKGTKDKKKQIKWSQRQLEQRRIWKKYEP